MKIRFGRRLSWLEKVGVTGLALCSALVFALVPVACERDSDPVPPAAADPAPLTLAPARATIPADQDVVILTARGGTRPYAWRVSDPDLGSVTDTDVGTVTYTRTAAPGAQVVQVMDRNRWVAECVIRQE